MTLLCIVLQNQKQQNYYLLIGLGTYNNTKELNVNKVDKSSQKFKYLI